MHRPRILRKSQAIRELVAETHLSAADFIAPLFVVEGSGIKEEISAIPAYERHSLDMIYARIENLLELGIKSSLLFIKCPDKLKDNAGSEAINPEGLMQRSIREIKKRFPEMLLMSDVALDPYSSHGHDGIVHEQRILNDETVEILAEMARSHAEAGVDMVAPSDMMDGRIGAIRDTLEQYGHTRTGIMSYSAKYASSYYGPFRTALDSAPGFGDKSGYQMNPANRRAAIREVELDIEEGADIVMIKPAINYLDIIREIRDTVHVPVSAYHVSGEYAMIKAAAERGWIDEQRAMMEATISIKRAGANLIASYAAADIVKQLQEL